MHGRTVEAKEKKEKDGNIRKVAREKSVGTATVACLLKRYREMGSYGPRAQSNGRKQRAYVNNRRVPIINEETPQRIRVRVKEQPGIAIHELKEAFGLSVSLPALMQAAAFLHHSSAYVVSFSPPIETPTAPRGEGKKDSSSESNPVDCWLTD